MKITKFKVGYSTSIPIAMYGIKDGGWAELEIELDEGEQFNFSKMWCALKDEVDETVREKYPHLYNGIEHTPEFAQMAENVEKFNKIMYGKKQQPSTREEIKIGDIENDIRSCKELKVLETYRFIAKSKPEFQKAYDEVYAKLSNQNTTTK